MNPILSPHVCMADGEPHVFGDRLYLFGSHDTPGGESFCLEDYEFYSAPLNDLSNWTGKGTNYSAKQDPLYGENAKYLYAPRWKRFSFASAAMRHRDRYCMTAFCSA